MPSQSEPPAEAGMVQYYPGALGALQWSAGCVRLRLPLARLGANVEIQISEDQRAFEEVCGVEINRLVPVSGKKKYIPTGGSQGR